MGLFDKIKQGLSKTKEAFTEKIDNVLSSFRKVDEDLLDELEEALISADVGVMTSVDIIDRLRNEAKSRKIADSEELKDISTKVGTLEKSDATNTVIIQKLCDQLSGLTKAIYSLAVGVGVAILTVILTALLK
jgi:signal recognition particle GTPase